MTGPEDRRAAIRAQLDTLNEHELRVLVAHLALRDTAAVEVSLAEFLAIRAQVRETSRGMLPPDADATDAAALEAARPDPAVRRELHAELDQLTAQRRAWEETVRACMCQPGQCSRGEFRDHQGDSPGCMVCADLDPDQPCYAAVREREARQ